MRISLHEHRRVFTSPAPREESKATNRAGHDGIKTQPWRTAGRARQKTRSENRGRDAEGGARVGARTGKTEMGKESGEQSFRFHGDRQLRVHTDKAPEDATHQPRQGAQRASFSGSGRPRGTGAGSCLGSCHICKSPPQATPDGTGVTTTPPPSGTWSSARGAARRCPLEARAVCTVYAHREGSPLPPGLRLNVKAALTKVSRGRHVAKHGCLLHLTLHVILLERPSPPPTSLCRVGPTRCSACWPPACLCPGPSCAGRVLVARRLV